MEYKQSLPTLVTLTCLFSSRIFPIAMLSHKQDCVYEKALLVHKGHHSLD